MLEAISRARHEILLEMYWFGSDRVGLQFAEALSTKAAQGARVKIIYDAVGSLQTDAKMFSELREAGCEVVQYNPIAPWRAHFRIAVVHKRDHRKMLIVDRRVGFTGGVNLSDPWAPKELGGEGWRDDMVKIDGPAVEQMRAVFNHVWGRLTGPPAAAAQDPPSPSELATVEGSHVRILANHYIGGQRAIRYAYLDRIDQARRTVRITNSYFVPDGRIRRALSRAAARGVDVRVIVPGRSDVFAAFYAGRKLYGRLLEAGIRLYEWTGPILHSKTAVIDGTWCTVGTYNLDYRSWRFNLEVTAAVDDRPVARALEERFYEDLRRCKPVDYARWRARPLQSRLLEDFFYRFRRLL